MDNRNKSSVLQWVIPTAIMMVVVMAMLINFSNKSSTEAEETVAKTLLASTESFGSRFINQLDVVKSTAKPIRALLEKEGADDPERVAQLLGIMVECSDVYKVVYCDVNGKGLDQNGAEVSVAGTDYFAALQQPETPYIYTEEGQPTIIIAEHIATENLQGYLLLYYPMLEFSTMMSKSGYDSVSFLTVIDENGKILGVSGAGTSNCLATGNLLEAIEPDNSDTARTMRNRISNGSRATSEITMGKQSHMLVYVPLGINHWELVLGVSQDYVGRQVNYQWRNTKSMVSSLIVVIFVFLCIVVIINIVSRIRSNEKRKELEDKADTDLLTGLNNKLATERKIKTYMTQNPQSQSMMFLLDIDNFKKINDTMGHAFGDEVLRSLGIQIGSIFRATDIIGRVGGDEFMIFLKGIPDEEAILKEAKKVETFFKGFQAGEYVKYAATASIGVAIFPQEGADFETLYKAADQGLYKAKKRGKNQLAFYSDERSSTKQEKPVDKAE